MIKNTHALNLIFLFLYSTSLHSYPAITINDLTPPSIEKLHLFSKANEGPFTIHVVPQKQWMERITGFLTSPFVALRNKLSLKNIGFTLFSATLSLGWISYLWCTYLIYKTYQLLKNAHSWVNWCSDDDLFSDEELLYQKIDWHQKKRSPHKHTTYTALTLQQEKRLLSLYLHIDSFLKTHQIRHYFPGANMPTHQRILSAYKKLQKAEELLTLRKKKTLSFAENR